MDDLSYFKALHTNFGVCCLNHNPLNILMWSHYAQDHTGFLIEFKFLKRELNKGASLLEFLPIPVNYAKIMPIVSKSDRLNLDQMVITEKVYLTKAEEWKYEKEFRILKYGISDPIQDFSQQKFLCSVIAGLKMNATNREELEKICEENNIPFYTADRISNSYGLTISSHPRLDVLNKPTKKK